jgi:hypothetical protein
VKYRNRMYALVVDSGIDGAQPVVRIADSPRGAADELADLWKSGTPTWTKIRLYRAHAASDDAASQIVEWATRQITTDYNAHEGEN